MSAAISGASNRRSTGRDDSRYSPRLYGDKWISRAKMPALDAGANPQVSAGVSARSGAAAEVSGSDPWATRRSLSAAIWAERNEAPACTYARLQACRLAAACEFITQFGSNPGWSMRDDPRARRHSDADADESASQTKNTACNMSASRLAI